MDQKMEQYGDHKYINELKLHQNQIQGTKKVQIRMVKAIFIT